MAHELFNVSVADAEALEQLNPQASYECGCLHASARLWPGDTKAVRDRLSSSFLIQIHDMFASSVSSHTCFLFGWRGKVFRAARDLFGDKIHVEIPGPFAAADFSALAQELCRASLAHGELFGLDSEAVPEVISRPRFTDNWMIDRDEFSGFPLLGS